jgi:hypothetical protein
MADLGAGFVAVGSDPTGLPTSWSIETDGRTTRSPLQPSLRGTDPLAVVASHDETVAAVAVGLFESSIVESSDGMTWTETATIAGTVRGLEFDGTRWLAVGRAPLPKAGEAEDGAAIWASSDLRSWDRVFTALSTFSSFEDVTVAGGHRVAVGAGSEHGIGLIASSADGRSWTRPGAAGAVCGAPNAVTRYRNGFLAVGGPAPFVSYTSTDGVEWTRFATSLSGCANARGTLAVSANVVAALFPRERRPGFLAPGGNHGLYLSEDGIDWERVDDGAPFESGTVLATIGTTDDRIVVTGYDEQGAALWIWSPNER